MMRILISGGGLAGLTLAYWLHYYGFTPVVIEKSNGLRRDGYGIDFAGTGYDVAEYMGILDALKQRQIEVNYLTYVNSSGKVVAGLKIKTMRDALNGRYIGLMHRVLEETIYAAITNRVEVRFNTSLNTVQQTADTVTATFTSGQTESFDLLIGADGIHSYTRQLVFGPEAQFARYLGYYVAAFPLPDQYGIGHNWVNYAEPGRQVGAYCSDKSGEIITSFVYETPNVGYILPEQRLSKLQHVYQGMGWFTSQFLADIADPYNIFMDSVTQIIMPHWSNGRIALVGDACGCMTLISGQGASMAMGGAYILAQFLAESDDYKNAFRRYETWLRPHVEHRQKNAHGSAKAFVPHTKLALLLQMTALKILGQDIFAGLIKRQFAMTSILPPQKH